MIHFWENISSLIICSRCNNEDENNFKEEESIEILNIPALIENI